jgi:phospholipase C
MMGIGRVCLLGFAVVASAASAGAAPVGTTTPIKHLVVIFQENNSFDHYFGTYPKAANPPGEPVFVAADDTPTVNGLNDALLDHNPNSVAPFRLDRSQAALDCDNDNAYAAEQAAFDHGLMDKFPEDTSSSATPPSGDEVACPAGIAMGYYDGNTVTALWNYAQHFAMSDNFYDTEFGTTAMGHLNLISGQTHRSHRARPDLGHALHRGQLADRTDRFAGQSRRHARGQPAARPRLLRPSRRLDPGHVRLRRPLRRPGRPSAHSR